MLSNCLRCRQESLPNQLPRGRSWVTPLPSNQPIAPNAAAAKKFRSGGTIRQLRGLLRTKGTAGARPGLGMLGLNNERTQARGTAKSDGSNRGPEQKSQCEAGQARA